MNSNSEKKCSKCGKSKKLSEFYKHKQHKDGLRYTCKGCGRAETTKWRRLNSRKKRETDKKYNEVHPTEVRKYKSKWNKKNRETQKGKLNNRMGTAVRDSIKKGRKAGRKWETLVGYTVDSLKRHIEKQFKKGMNWQLFMEGKIHIDHIIPIAAFNFSAPEDIDFKRCWALKNLRPMWAKENFIKHDRVDKPFQPSLAMGDS